MHTRPGLGRSRRLCQCDGTPSASWTRGAGSEANPPGAGHTGGASDCDGPASFSNREAGATLTFVARTRSSEVASVAAHQHSAKRVLAESPLGQLRKARAAKGGAARAKYARAGLAGAPEDAETRWLLMRQLYISHLELGALDLARGVATDMIGVYSEVEDVARFDLARVHLGTNEWDEARRQLAAGERVAPPTRRWEHVFTRARLEAVLGQPELASSLVDAAAEWNQPAGSSVVRLAKDPVLHAAKLVWRAQAGKRPRRDTLARAYQQLSDAGALPALGDFFAARLLWLLSHAEARSVLEGFLRTTARLPAIARFGLAPEVFYARQWLGKPLHLT